MRSSQRCTRNLSAITRSNARHHLTHPPSPHHLRQPPTEATHLARTLVEERLAACATLIPAVQSIYHWEGAIESATETLLLLKTGPEQLPALEARLHQLHSYQTPEFLVLDVEGVS